MPFATTSATAPAASSAATAAATAAPAASSIATPAKRCNPDCDSDCDCNYSSDSEASDPELDVDFWKRVEKAREWSRTTDVEFMISTALTFIKNAQVEMRRIKAVCATLDRTREERAAKRQRTIEPQTQSDNNIERPESPTY
jgi:hypothetical protein